MYSPLKSFKFHRKMAMLHKPKLPLYATTELHFKKTLMLHRRLHFYTSVVYIKLSLD